MEQPFEKRYVKYEADAVLPGCRYIKKEKNYFIFSYNGSSVLVFKDFDSASEYVDGKIISYFNANRSQLLPFYVKYVDEKWRKVVDWSAVYEFISANFEALTGKQWEPGLKHEELSKIKENIIGHIKTLCENNLEKISEAIYSFANRNYIFEVMRDGIEFRIYEHGSYFYVIDVDLRSIK